MQRTALVCLAMAFTVASCSSDDAEPKAKPTAPVKPSASPADPSAIARSYLQLRADLVLKKPGKGDIGAFPATARLRRSFERDRTELGKRGKRYTRLDGGYSRAEVALDQAKLRGGKLRAREETKLFFVDATGGAPSHETYDIRHTFSFVKSGGRWLLDKDVPHLASEDIPPITIVTMSLSSSGHPKEANTGRPAHGASGPGRGPAFG